jgi:hypothetical protein
MGLDPNILLQTTNINAEAAKQTAIATQAAAQAGQLRLQQYTIQQAKSDFEDQQNLKQAWRAANGDPTRTLATAAAMGVSPKFLQAFQMQQASLQEKLDAHAKAIDEHGNSVLDQKMKQGELEYSALKPLIEAKNDVEFQSKKPQVIASLKGIAPDSDINMLVGATQQQVQDYGTSHLNMKALAALKKGTTDQQGADAKTSEAATAAQKQANESATQIETAKRAVLEGASTTLTNALRSGGPVAYNKALQDVVAKAGSNGELVTGSFPSAAAITQFKSPAEAFSAINSGGMTSQQRQQAQQTQAQQAQTAAYQKQEIALRQRSANIQEQMLGLDRSKTQAALYAAGLGPDGKPIPGNDKTLLDPNLQNTSDGRHYIDQDAALKGLPKGDQIQLKRAAAASGTPMLSAKDAGAIHSADSARNMINGVFDTFIKNSGDSVLNKPFQNFRNSIDVHTGMNPELEAASKNFLTSIDTLKTAGGMGSGLRITGAEIQKIGSLMPKLGDTKDQVRQKAIQINNLINDNLDQALHTVKVNGSATKPTGPADLKSMSTDDLLKQLAGK